MAGERRAPPVAHAPLTRRRRAAAASPRTMRRGLCEAGVEAVGDEVARQVDADEHHLVGLLLGRQPLRGEIAAHHLMHALEHDLAVDALHVQHALVAQHPLAVDLQNAAEEILELVRIERAIVAVDERLDLVVVVRVVMIVVAVPVIVLAMAVIVIAMRVIVVVIVVMRVRVIVFREEVRIDLELRVQVEAAQVEDLLDVRIAEVHDLDRRLRVHVQQAVLELGHRLVVDEVRLRDEQAIGEADLALHDFVLVELRVRMLRVDERDDRVEQEFVGDLAVDEERLRDRARIREARRLDHHAVEVERAVALFRGEVGERAREVAANRAADAAVAHLDDLLGRILDEDLVVDVLFAELVFDHGDLHAVLFVQDALEQRGLAAAEKAREDGDGNGHVVGRLWFVKRGQNG
ncbi:hypothetical protein BURPS1710b_0388 [Burkholderia pseudomallei 1710b]|uniref:Uncharacterized protein n=1 Tax=Burkholderia pseudomallei (strain 1710b) TaxID=320372 RepID=Q3JXA1_BURP1|nr:hypothetical protein BURPS1710b_0388 [Burkholderia pseudomallei 1710b]